MAVRALEGSE